MGEILKTKSAQIPYDIIRTKRKTMGISVGPDGSVEVRIPMRGTLKEAREYAEEKIDWIINAQEGMKKRLRDSLNIDWESLKKDTYPWIRGEGGKMFRDKVAYWSEVMGLDYNKITIKDTSTRWGSCSSNKNINFSWKLFIMPEKMLDYLIVHELAHLQHMDHSKAFWNLVGQYIPEYDSIKKEMNKKYS